MRFGLFLPASQQVRFWKVLLRIFPENTALVELYQEHRFKQVGVYEKHDAQLDGVWRDVVIVEKVLLPK
jgi:L-amino acid N-acyltransferase YncA